MYISAVCGSFLNQIARLDNLILIKISFFGKSINNFICLDRSEKRLVSTKSIKEYYPLLKPTDLEKLIFC